MNMLQRLMELQESYDVVEQCNKVLKDGSDMDMLKKLKIEFEAVKVKYVEKEKNLKEIKVEYEKMSENEKEVKKTLEKLEEALYNHTGGNLERIEMLQSKVEKQRSILKEAEEQELEFLEKEEKTSSDSKVLKINLLKLKESFYNCKEGNSKKNGNARKDLEQAEIKILALEKQIAEPYLNEFHYIYKSKKNAIVKMQGATCKGCRMKVSAITLDQITKNKEMVHCDNCGRILFYENERTLKIAE